MKLAIVKWIVKTILPGYQLAPPSYHVHKNPVAKPKLAWKESTLEDARDMAIEIAERRREHDGI
jgi:hypothetical protein